LYFIGRLKQLVFFKGQPAIPGNMEARITGKVRYSPAFCFVFNKGFGLGKSGTLKAFQEQLAVRPKYLFRRQNRPN